MKQSQSRESGDQKVIHVKHWPNGDSPRERLLQKGPEGLSDAALLAVLLRTGSKGKDVIALAREVLAEFDGISGLIAAGREDLKQIEGLGDAKVAQILAAMEMVKRQLRRPLARSNLMENPDDLQHYLKATMTPLSREEFRIFYLNRLRHLISEEVLFKGGPDITAVDPKKVVASAVRKRASALILAHNHPTDLPLVSEEDIRLTQVLVRACWAADIPILDHVVIGRNSCLSLKRRHPEIFEGEDEIA